jgi:hypothetical protein
MSTREVIFYGKSGYQYRYWIFPVTTTFKTAAGNYVFANDNGMLVTPLYFGQTDDLNRRLNSDWHDGRACAVRNGANVICAHTSGDKEARCEEELDLVAAYNPRCNL